MNEGSKALEDLTNQQHLDTLKKFQKTLQNMMRDNADEILNDASQEQVKTFIPYSSVKQISQDDPCQNPFIGTLFQGATLKQIRSQTIQNYISHLSDFYDTFTPKQNQLSLWYPKMLRRNLEKRKNQTSNRIVQGLRRPVNKKDSEKAIQRIQLLTKCQANFVQMVLQKIDRRSKPIKKHEKVIN